MLVPHLSHLSSVPACPVCFRKNSSVARPPPPKVSALLYSAKKKKRSIFRKRTFRPFLPLHVYRLINVPYLQNLRTFETKRYCASIRSVLVGSMAVKGLVASIIRFLTQQLEEGDITADSRESLEVAIQCLESAYNVQASDAPPNLDLYQTYSAAAENARPAVKREPTAEEEAEAERLKTEGNNFMKEDKPQEALQSYTKAIELDGAKAVYYCNRAAVHSKMGNHQFAVKDATTALSIDPSYSKAYARMGLAYSSLEKFKEAKECYQKASEMEPENECYKKNIQLAEEKLAQQGVSNMGLCGGGVGGGAGLGNMDLSSIIGNPTFVNMARQMFTDPGMRNMMSFLTSGDVEQGARMEALIEAGHRLVDEIQTTNPELLESLRRQMRGPNDPEPPQNN